MTKFVKIQMSHYTIQYIFLRNLRRRLRKMLKAVAAIKVNEATTVRIHPKNCIKKHFIRKNLATRQRQFVDSTALFEGDKGPIHPLTGGTMVTQNRAGRCGRLFHFYRDGSR